MKLRIAIAFTIVLFLGSVAGAADYTFTWNANHVNDEVDEYRIYYRLNSSQDYAGYETVAVTDRTISPVTATISPPDAAEEYCFAATAVGENGYESDKSNEDGEGESCALDDDDDTDDGTDGGSGGGGGGGCFLMRK